MSEHDESPDLGPKPDARTEPGEPNPGGTDALPADDESTDGEPISRDLDPDNNPAVEEALPDEVKELEDTDTEATKGDGGGEDVPPEDESPA